MVLAPGATDVVGFFQYDEVVEASFFQACRHRQPGKSRPHDDNLNLIFGITFGANRLFLADALPLTKGKVTGQWTAKPVVTVLLQ